MAIPTFRGIYMKYIFIVSCMLSFCAILALYNSKDSIHSTYDEISDFFGFTQNIVIHDNVCIEADGNNKRIVVYNSVSNREQRIKVGGGRHQQDKTWLLHFRNIAIPETHTKMDTHAYFIKHTCDGNLHHFWTDTFDGLYGALKRAKDIKDGQRMHAFYALTASGKMAVNAGSCHARERYEPFIYALGASYHDGFDTIQTNTCFEKGVFGYIKSPVKRGELEHLMRSKMNVTETKCHGKHPRILIQDRHERRMLNSDKLKHALESQLAATVNNVYFEDIPLHEQLQAIYCADILIGIQGAGLEHYRFLRPGSAVLEIGWPHWPAGRYKRRANSLGYAADVMGNCDAKLTNHSWNKYFDHNTSLKDKSRDYILQLVDKVSFGLDKNIWKFADCELDITETVIKVKALLLK